MDDACLLVSKVEGLGVEMEEGFPGRGNSMSKGPEGAAQISGTKKRQVCSTLKKQRAWHEMRLERWAEVRRHGGSQAEERTGSLILRTTCTAE